MDDGANPKEWKRADIIVLGVSRCGKTPLSIYLGQRGYKASDDFLSMYCIIPAPPAMLTLHIMHEEVTHPTAYCFGIPFSWKSLDMVLLYHLYLNILHIQGSYLK